MGIMLPVRSHLSSVEQDEQISSKLTMWVDSKEESLNS